MRFVRTAENLFGLPQGFTRVEYLETNASKYYIDTGYKANNTTKVEIKTQGQTWTFGGRTSIAVGDALGICFNANLVALQFGSQSIIYNQTGIAQQVSECVISQDGAYINGVLRASFMSETFSCPNNLYLFDINNNGSLGDGLKGKMWYCKIWDNNTLVRDFIPCIDPLGVACMYDLVGKKPYYNQGTGTFTVGRQIIPVEYLEGTGTQYIDTGLDYFADFEVGIQLRNNVSNKALGNGAFCCMQRYNASNPYWYFTKGSGTSNSYASSTTITEYHVMKWKDDKIYSDDVLLTEFTKDLNTPNRMCLFGVSSANKYPNMIYFCKLWNPEDGTLVRDYIPCKDENDVGFMFDKVSGSCYLNAGTGAFSVGENKYTSKIRLIKEAKELPDGYKRVEYLESTGTQYINLNYIPTDTTGYKMGQVIPTSNSRDNIIIGCRQATNSDSRFWQDIDWSTANKTIGWGFGGYSPKGQRYSVVDKAGTYVVTSLNYMNDRAGKVDGVSYDTSLESKTLPEISRPMYLFAGNNGGTDGYYVSTKIYFVQMTEGNKIVRDFIPCLDSNNRPCMFDLVEGKPYYNLGTGDFTYGHTITPVEYLESTGTQYINTGIKLDNNSSVELYYQLTQAVQNRKGLFGGLGTGGSRRFGALLSPSNNQLESGYGSGNEFYQLGLPDTNIHVLKQAKNLLYFDGSLIYTFNTATFTQSFNAPLGNFNFTNYNPASAKYYRSKWWDNGTLVRSFIPVRDENNVGYMFDEVTGQLFGNAGSGSFGIGNDLPKPKVRFIQDVIPSAYLPLKYLESTGTQYIDLCVGVKANTVFKATFSIASTATGRSYFGARNSSNERFQIVNSIGIGGGYYLSNTVYPIANQKYEIEMHANGDMYLDGVKRNASTGTFSQVAFERNLWLFATNYYDSSVGPGASTFWSAIIYEGNVPVRDLYPALRKSDNKPGMYDRITKQFFVNKGTGEFNYG